VAEKATPFNMRVFTCRLCAAIKANSWDELVGEAYTMSAAKSENVGPEVPVRSATARLLVVFLVAAGLSSCSTPKTSTAGASKPAEQPPPEHPTHAAETSVGIQAPETSPAPEGPTIDIGNPNLAVDFNLPPGTLRGQRLKDYHESSLRQDVGPFDQEIRAAEKARSERPRLSATFWIVESDSTASIIVGT